MDRIYKMSKKFCPISVVRRGHRTPYRRARDFRHKTFPKKEQIARTFFAPLWAFLNFVPLLSFFNIIFVPFWADFTVLLNRIFDIQEHVQDYIKMNRTRIYSVLSQTGTRALKIKQNLTVWNKRNISIEILNN